MPVMTEETGSRPFAFIAGHVALDLLNTVDWRLDAERRSEGLTAYEDVLVWAGRGGLISKPETRVLTRLARADPTGATNELAQLRRTRETVYRALVERSAEAVSRVVEQHRDALTRVALVETDGHWTWTEHQLGLITPRDRVVRAAVELLTSSSLANLHQCEDVACGWVYLDTSPRRNRRWCVAAECGNRNRARRFYARRR